MELSHLKDIAAKLNMNVHHNIGVEKLTKQIKERCEELGTTIEEVSLSVQKAQNDPESSETSVGTLEDTPEVIEENKDVESTPAYDPAYIEKLKHITFAAAEAQSVKQSTEERLRDAMKLVRCTITCNNKNKAEYQGEIFSVQNAVLGEVKKFVPFGVITHIPQIMFNMLKEKQYQMFKTKREHGIPKTTSHLIPEYNIQIHDPITKEELEAIKQKQLAEGFNGE